MQLIDLLLMTDHRSCKGKIIIMHVDLMVEIAVLHRIQAVQLHHFTLATAMIRHQKKVY
jgi:hypothetical protein